MLRHTGTSATLNPQLLEEVTRLNVRIDTLVEDMQKTSITQSLSAEEHEQHFFLLRFEMQLTKKHLELLNQSKTISTQALEEQFNMLQNAILLAFKTNLAKRETRVIDNEIVPLTPTHREQIVQVQSQQLQQITRDYLLDFIQDQAEGVISTTNINTVLENKIHNLTTKFTEEQASFESLRQQAQHEAKTKQVQHEVTLKTIENLTANAAQSLHTACMNNNLPRVKELISLYYEQQKQTRSGMQKLTNFFISSTPKVPEIINAQDENGETPLHLAAFHGHENVVWCLLENGANRLQANIDGNLALHLAARGGHLPIIKLLLRKDMKTQLSAQGQFKQIALDDVAYHVHDDALGYEIATYLIQQGSPIHPVIIQQPSIVATDKEYTYTPLHNAAAKGHAGVVKAILEMSDTSKPMTLVGSIVLREPSQLGHLNVLKLFHEYGYLSNPNYLSNNAIEDYIKVKNQHPHIVCFWQEILEIRENKRETLSDAADKIALTYLYNPTAIKSESQSVAQTDASTEDIESKRLSR